MMVVEHDYDLIAAFRKFCALHDGVAARLATRDVRFVVSEQFGLALFFFPRAPCPSLAIAFSCTSLFL